MHAQVNVNVSYGIVAGEGLEAEGVVLLADEDLVGDGQRPLETQDSDVKNCIKISLILNLPKTNRKKLQKISIIFGRKTKNLKSRN